MSRGNVCFAGGNCEVHCVAGLRINQGKQLESLLWGLSFYPSCSLGGKLLFHAQPRLCGDDKMTCNHSSWCISGNSVGCLWALSLIGCILYSVLTNYHIRVAKMKVASCWCVSVPCHNLWWKIQRKQVVLPAVICDAVITMAMYRSSLMYL